MTHPDALAAASRVWKQRFGREIDDVEAERILQACLELYPVVHDLRIDKKFGWDLRDVSEGGDIVIDRPAKEPPTDPQSPKGKG